MKLNTKVVTGEVKLNYITGLKPNIVTKALEQIATETPDVYNNLRTNLPSILKTYPELQPMKQVLSMTKQAMPVSTRLGIKFLPGGKPTASTQLTGITPSSTVTQIAKVDIDSVFSTLTSGECRPKVTKSTAPVLEDVIEGALRKLDKPTITKSMTTAKPNIIKNVGTVFKTIL